jgi:uracil-DNA glycosylase
MTKYIYDVSWAPLFKKYEEKIDDNLYRMYHSSNDIPVFPTKQDIFKVFEMPVDYIKIVLLGQDPYHGFGQAHGLSFSVNKNVKIPPSLKNIFKEIQTEYPEREYNFDHGNLERWFNEEKIFLLNSSLTVEKGKPGSFIVEWKEFTDDVIRFISEHNNHCVFLLLGNFAINKSDLIKQKKNIIVRAHPSPLSAHRGFLGTNVFKEIEKVLGYEIDWRI